MAEVSKSPMSALIGNRSDRPALRSWTVVILSLSVNVRSEPHGSRPRHGGFEMEDYIPYRHRLEHQNPSGTGNRSSGLHTGT